MTCPKKINHLIRKYDLLIQEYAKATPKLDELMFFECFLGKQFSKSFFEWGALTVRFSGGRGPGEAAFKHYEGGKLISATSKAQ